MSATFLMAINLTAATDDFIKEYEPGKQECVDVVLQASKEIASLGLAPIKEHVNFTLSETNHGSFYYVTVEHYDHTYSLIELACVISDVNGEERPVYTVRRVNTH